MPEPARRVPIVKRAIAVEGGLILLALALARLSGRSLFDLIALDWEGLLAGLLATLPLYAAMVWSTRTSLPPFPRVRRDVERLVMPMFRGLMSWEMALVALLAGVGEELFFRGLMQTGLAGVTGVWTALILTSVLFGALHWVTATYAALAGLVGLYLGAFMVVSGNLAVPILVHALYDFLALRYLVGLGNRTIAGENSGAGSERTKRGGIGGPGDGEAAAPGPGEPS